MSSAFVAELLGLYIVVSCGVFLVRQERFMEYARNFAEDISLRYTVAFLELAAGLAIILSYRSLELGYRGVIAVIGWMMLAEAVFHLLASEEQEKKVIDKIDSDVFLKGFAVAGLGLGLYLATKGFTCF